MSEQMNIQQDTTDESQKTAHDERHKAHGFPSVGAGGDEQQTDNSASLVPVTEAKKYRKRAQAAEQSLRDIEQQFEVKSQRIEELEQIVSELERRHRINELLVEADAIDLEAARLLTEVAVRQMDEPDVEAAVEDLQRTRPFLFRAAHARRGSAMSERVDRQRRAANDIERAAGEASESGHRNDLLRYLRLRRRNGRAAERR